MISTKTSCRLSLKGIDELSVGKLSHFHEVKRFSAIIKQRRMRKLFPKKHDRDTLNGKKILKVKLKVKRVQADNSPV